MNLNSPIRINRRQTLTASALLAVGLTQHAAAIEADRATMVGGGGTVAVDESLVDFAIAGLRMQQGEDGDPQVHGQLRWLDPDNRMTIESLMINEFKRDAEESTKVVISGKARLSGAGEHPFTLEVVDGGPPLSGFDTVTLTLGEDGAEAVGTATYEATGILTGGDVQIFDIEFTE